MAAWPLKMYRSLSVKTRSGILHCTGTVYGLFGMNSAFGGDVTLARIAVEAKAVSSCSIPTENVTYTRGRRE